MLRTTQCTTPDLMLLDGCAILGELQIESVQTNFNHKRESDVTHRV